jgi:hypothetical protein
VIPAGSRSPTRRKPCRVCSLPSSELQLLEHGLIYGWSARFLAARFKSLSRRDVQGHMKCAVNKEKEEEECR